MYSFENVGSDNKVVFAIEKVKYHFTYIYLVFCFLFVFFFKNLCFSWSSHRGAVVNESDQEP